MGRKNKPDSRGFVYSTDPDFHFEEENEDLATLTPGQQKLQVRLDSKHRAGKAVTLVTGFIGKKVDFEELAKKLRSFCGTGGSAKDGEMIIQGDQREKVIQWLTRNGYKNVKKM